MSKNPDWLVVFKKTNGKPAVVRMPGGLHEAEAQRNAALKAPKFSAFVRIYRADPAQVRAAFDRNIDACLRAV